MSAEKTTVCLSFDFDAVSIWAGALGMSTPTAISRGEFGANVATPRILELLSKEEVPTTWFIPGLDAETFPDACKQVRDDGHEVGHHNYAHENTVNATEEERRIVERGIEALENVLGVRPVGFRSPAWDLSPYTVDILVDNGFEYDSSAMAHDYWPYYCRTGDVVHADRPPVWGTETNLVEVPVSWGLDDFPFTEFILGTTMTATTDIVAMGERWIADLDFLIDNLDGGVFTLTMHPQAIGRSSRLLLLRNVIRHGKERGVKFATIKDVAASFARGDGF